MLMTGVAPIDEKEKWGNITKAELHPCATDTKERHVRKRKER